MSQSGTKWPVAMALRWSGKSRLNRGPSCGQGVASPWLFISPTTGRAVVQRKDAKGIVTHARDRHQQSIPGGDVGLPSPPTVNQTTHRSHRVVAGADMPKPLHSVVCSVEKTASLQTGAARRQSSIRQALEQSSLSASLSVNDAKLLAYQLQMLLPPSAGTLSKVLMCAEPGEEIIIQLGSDGSRSTSTHQHTR
ncbi:hypothetical protein VTJ49DRAFT_3907 [Mycothermus thermophilus]|uniref:Uncharacterized protein n=1 Tax=Humicola insolens TaxID=85995 RepID=A0ABR3VN93_HUMIN